MAIPIVMEYSHTGMVRRFPTLGLVSAMVVCGGVSFVTGLILQAITLTRREIKQIAYLASVANTPSK
ncbi:hypothetical protein [Comamonas sp. JC664]|uniref:hypothetical protein n=1 Tax=Comamonas sp. JC664 TaxID=2801917 RepID=UPI00362404EC